MPSSERSTTQGPALPSYRELPVAEGGVHSGWHVFGADDNRGLMNLITPEVTLRASSTVRRGAVFPLDVPTGYVSPPLFSRGAPRHTVLEPRPGRTLDDVHDNVYPQSGSQWDSLGHAAFLPGQFYNGATTEQVKSGVRNTIEHWARSGIATRGIVLDVSDAVAERGGPGASVAVTVEDLENARIRAQVEYRPGDILLVHTGFLDWYRDQDETVRRRLAVRETLTAAGLEHSEAMAEYLWDGHVAAVASDTAGLEVWPPDESEAAFPFGFLHPILLGVFGMAIGELWQLSDLVADCRTDDVWECLLVSAPLNAPGGIGSPANATAIK
jgi:kynurenine formamidase